MATTLSKLEELHDKQASAIVRKYLSNLKYQPNPNDIFWMYHDPQVKKQLGRSAKVFYKLLALEDS